MQVTETVSDGLKREFKIVITAEDMSERVTSRITEMVQTVRLPGFRPGKVPVALLQRRFGAQIYAEELNKAVEETTGNTLKEHGLTPAVQPVLETVNETQQQDQDFECKLLVEAMPDIPSPDYGTFSFERVSIRPTDEEVDREMENAVGQVDLFEPAGDDTTAQWGDCLVIDFRGTIDGETFEHGEAEDFKFVLAQPDRFLEGFSVQLIGSRGGDTKTVAADFPAEHPSPDLASKSAEFAVSVKEVLRRKPVNLDDAFVREHFGLNDVQAFKNAVHSNLEAQAMPASKERLKTQVFKRLNEIAVGMELPPTLLDNEYANICLAVNRDKARTSDAVDAATRVEGPAAQQIEGPRAEDADKDAGERQAEDAAISARDAAEPAVPQLAAGPGEAESADTAAEPVDGEASLPPDHDWTDEDKTAMREMAGRRMRISLMLQEIARLNDISISDKEITALYENVRRSILPGVDTRQLQSLGAEVLARLNSVVAVQKGMLLEQKTVDFVVAMSEITETVVTREEFAELLRKDSEEVESYGRPETRMVETDLNDMPIEPISANLTGDTAPTELVGAP